MMLIPHLPLHLVPVFAGRIAGLLCGWLFLAAAAAQQIGAGPWAPTPRSVVDDMLAMAAVGPQDFLIDLGSGDGRIVLAAVGTCGARGLGFELQERLVRRSNEAARRAGLAGRASFVRQDLYAADISQATVLTLYLLPGSVHELSAKLKSELRPGTRVLAHDYGLAGWSPQSTRTFEHEEKLRISGTRSTRLYLYVVPPHTEEEPHAA